MGTFCLSFFSKKIFGFSLATSLLIFILSSNASSALAQSVSKFSPLKISSAVVTLDGREVLFVQERVLSFSPEDRARAIGEKLHRLARDRRFKTDTLALFPGETSTDIVAGDIVVMSVTDRDARAAGLARDELAKRNVGLIQEAIASYRKNNSAKRLVWGISLSLLATAILLVLIKLLQLALPKVRSMTVYAVGRFPPLRFQKITLISRDQTAAFLDGAVTFGWWVVIVALVYAYLLVVFGLFPKTRDLAESLIGYLLVPLKVVGNAAIVLVPNLIFIAVIGTVVYFSLKIIKLIFNEIGRGKIAISGFFPEWAEPTYKIIRFLAFVLTAIVVFPYIPGSNSSAFKGVSVFLGILFSLGSTSAISNAVAGIILTYMRPYKMGDRVKIADTVGDIIEKSLLVTRVRTIKNMDVTIPNAMVLGSHIVNFSSTAQESGLILNTVVSIGYETPWRKVHELLIAAARSTEGILPKPDPFVYQTSLNDFYVTYELNAHTDQPQQSAAFYSNLHQNIQDKFNEAGVEIMSPHFFALRDGNKSTVPADHLPKAYEPPSFRILQASPSPTGMK